MRPPSGEPVTGSLRKSRKERRTEIAAAALRVVGQHGFQGATMARIADQLGISAPALYKHFPSRAEILEAALAQLEQPAFSPPDSFGARGAIDRIRLLVACQIPAGAGHRESEVAALLQLVAASGGSGVKEQLARRQRETMQEFVDILKDGQLQGSVRQDIDTVVVAWNLVGLTWMRDMALLEGVSEFVEEGIATSILENMLAAMSTGGESTDRRRGARPVAGAKGGSPGDR